MKCNNCGQEHPETARFCVHCGKSVSVKTANSRARSTRGNTMANPRPQSLYTDTPQRKNPTLAAILSLLIVGLGQFYNGDIKKGALMLIGGIILGGATAGALWLAIAIWSAIDAWQVASGQKNIRS